MSYLFEEKPYPWIVLVASLCTVNSVVPLILYSIILKTLITNPKFNKQISYVIMIHLGIFDCVLNATYFILGVFIAFQSTFHRFIENITGGLLEGSIYGIIFCTTLLAFNRFVVITEIVRLRKRFYHIALAVIWLLFISQIVLVLTPIANYVFYLDISILTITDNDYSNLLTELRYYSTITLISLSFVFYVFIIGALIRKRRGLTSNQKVMSKSEFRVMMQAAIIFIVCVINNVITFKAEEFLDIRTFGFIILMLLVEFNFGFVNPLLYLAVNTELRLAIFGRFMHRKTPVQSLQTVSIKTN